MKTHPVKEYLHYRFDRLATSLTRGQFLSCPRLQIRNRPTRIATMLAGAMTLLLTTLATLGLSPASADEDAPVVDPVDWGREIAYGMGNCSSCHAMSSDEPGILAGNLGPVLVAMRVRYPNIEQLRAQIYNAAAKNPSSTMPPYGTHKILTDEEIDAVTAFVWEL